MFDWLYFDGIGSCVFGEEGTGRTLEPDDVNTALRNKYLAQYLAFASKNGHTHPDFASDVAKLKRLELYTPLYFLMGACFAGIIFNPNYTSRHSFYLRKFTPIFFGVIGI